MDKLSTTFGPRCSVSELYSSINRLLDSDPLCFPREAKLPIPTFRFVLRADSETGAECLTVNLKRSMRHGLWDIDLFSSKTSRTYCLESLSITSYAVGSSPNRTLVLASFPLTLEIKDARPFPVDCFLSLRERERGGDLLDTKTFPVLSDGSVRLLLVSASLSLGEASTPEAEPEPKQKQNPN